VRTGHGGQRPWALRFFEGEPEAREVGEYPFRIALALEVRDGTLWARDVDDLCSWETACPVQQKIAVSDDHDHLLLLSGRPWR
jgi:hypothetical protein